MRRYYPPGEKGQPRQSSPGVTRMSLDRWRTLWREDTGAWASALRDRPYRFDPEAAPRAIAAWWNSLYPADREDSASAESDALRGVPFLVKDLFDIPGEVTSCSSHLFTDPTGPGGEPARSTSWLAERFVQLGAHCEGRTHMNEFAYGLDGRNAHFGDCPHPLDGRRISGGSSSGSAWAVAAGVVPVALGTDTGGSIRLPAALCGIYGYRMAYDAARLHGVFPLARSMDTVGWFTAHADDMAELMALVSGMEDAPTEDGSEDDAGDLSVGVTVPPGVEPDEEVATRWEAVLEAIAVVRGIKEVVALPSSAVLGDSAWKAYNVIGSYEAWSAHEKWVDRYRSLYDPTVWALIDRGRHWSEERLSEARAIREKVRECTIEWFREVDLVLVPATPSVSPLADRAGGRFREGVIRLNAPASLSGLAALSIPVAHDAVRSSGFQVLVPSGCEKRLIRFLKMWATVVQ